MYNLELQEGTFFNVTDNQEGTQKIILSSDVAQDFFPAGDAIGKKIMLVVGKVTFGPESLVGTYQESQNFGFVVPDDQKYARDIFIPKKLCQILMQILSWYKQFQIKLQHNL